jgi:hypothetical protein
MPESMPKINDPAPGHSVPSGMELAASAVLAFCVAFCITGPQAKAYADPGSGAVLWQLFFASIVSIGFQFRKLRQWFTNRKRR